MLTDEQERQDIQRQQDHLIRSIVEVCSKLCSVIEEDIPISRGEERVREDFPEDNTSSPPKTQSSSPLPLSLSALLPSSLQPSSSIN